MTVTRFDGDSLPEGWTAVEPSGAAVVVANGYCSLQSDAGSGFDGVSASNAAPQGPQIQIPVNGSFDYAVGLAACVSSGINQGVDLTALDTSGGFGIRFSQYVTSITNDDSSVFAFDRSDAGNITPAVDYWGNPDWGPRSWMRLSYDSGTGQYTLSASHVGKPVWHQVAQFTSTVVPDTFIISSLAFSPDAFAREQRVAVFVDMDGRGDDATTEPGDTTNTSEWIADFTTGSIPANFTDTVNGGATIVAMGDRVRLSCEMATADSYAWLIGPNDLPIDHGAVFRWSVPQPSVQNSFVGLATRASDSTTLPKSQVLTDKYRPGTGYVSEVNGAGSFGDIYRFLPAHPIDDAENFDGNQEFYGFSMAIQDTTAPVDGSTGDIINTRMEHIGGYLRVRNWYDTDPEPETWQYEGEDYTQRGNNITIAWSHNDSTNGGTIATSSFDLYSIEAYSIAEAAFDPILSGTGSIYDQIMAGLVEQGFTEGSISDRERSRLLSKLGFSLTIPGWSLYDLYREADEEPRIV